MGFDCKARLEQIRIWFSLLRVLRSGLNPRFVLAQLKKVRESCGLDWVLWRICRKRGGVRIEEEMLRVLRSGAQLRLCKRVEEIWEMSWDCLS